jgi:hypothetical protein
VHIQITIGVRMYLRKLIGNSRHLGLCLISCCILPESGHNAECISDAESLECCLPPIRFNGQPQLCVFRLGPGLKLFRGKCKIGRHHSDYLKRSAVDLEFPSHYILDREEMLPPEFVANDRQMGIACDFACSKGVAEVTKQISPG